MMQGGCLCGAVRFELDRAVGPFELCHCNRCRKTTGSAYAAGLGDADLRVDRHIFVEHRPRWTPRGDGLPELDEQALRARRAAGGSS